MSIVEKAMGNEFDQEGHVSFGKRCVVAMEHLWWRRRHR